jgi:hypothetical protein
MRQICDVRPRAAHAKGCLAFYMHQLSVPRCTGTMGRCAAATHCVARPHQRLAALTTWSASLYHPSANLHATPLVPKACPRSLIRSLLLAPKQAAATEGTAAGAPKGYGPLYIAVPAEARPRNTRRHQSPPALLLLCSSARNLDPAARSPRQSLRSRSALEPRKATIAAIRTQSPLTDAPTPYTVAGSARLHFPAARSHARRAVRAHVPGRVRVMRLRPRRAVRRVRRGAVRFG